MPAPTALQRKPDELADSVAEAQQIEETHPEDSFVLDPTSTTSLEDTILPDAPLDNDPSSSDMQLDATSGAPLFPPAADAAPAVRVESRKVLIPPHRFSPLKAAWPKLYPPLVNHLKLQVRMNVKSRAVELRTCRATADTGALQKGADFVRAFALGFDVDDAVALLRLDDLYIESFEIKDVKTLQGDHLGRAVGRIAGKDGKTKFAIENASRTRIVLADSKIHILGGFQNIRAARESVVSLILGQPPGKVYGNLRTVSARMKERF